MHKGMDAHHGQVSSMGITEIASFEMEKLPVLSSPWQKNDCIVCTLCI